jgi:uncharacterized RDD family membrane protein YckC
LSGAGYQGIGPRFVAQLVDSVIFVVLFYLIGVALSGGFTFGGIGRLMDTAPFPFYGVCGLSVFVYYIVLEGLQGATVGKMVVKIRVVREDGSACGFGPALVRNLLRIVDGLPFLYIIGLVLISRSDRKQRLGDRVAKTIVIKAEQARVPNVPIQPPQRPPSH